VNQVENVAGDYSDQDVMILGDDHAHQMPADALDSNFNEEDLILEDDSGNQPTVSFKLLFLKRGRSFHPSPSFPRLPIAWITMNLNGQPKRILKTCSVQSRQHELRL
jgi:hypothetical protein